MATENHSGIPAEITAGETITIALSAPTDETTPECGLYFRGQHHEMFFSVDGAVDPADSTSWLFPIGHAKTANLPPGIYSVTRLNTDKDNGDVTPESLGHISLKPNPTLAPEQTEDEKNLALVQAAISALLEGGAVQRHNIGGVQIDKITLPELQQLERELKSRVMQARGEIGRRIELQFS